MKQGGGLSILYKDTLSAHRWMPCVPTEYKYVEKERQWLLIRGEHGRKLAFLHCYIACQSFTSDDFLKWNEDLFSLLTQEALQLRCDGFMVLAMGDFNTHVGNIPGLEGNSPNTNRNHPMFTEFVTEVNLLILNTLPMCQEVFTWFKGNKKSLLDYGLIDADHVQNIKTFVIDENARHASGSDHALLQCTIEFDSSPRIEWNFDDVMKYDFNDSTDFTNYSNMLDRTLKTVNHEQFSKMALPDMLTHITTSIQASAKTVFGVTNNKRKNKGVELPKTIRSKIRQKGEVAKALHKATLDGDLDNIRKYQGEIDLLKENISNGISNMRLRKRTRLRAKLLKDDPSRRKFWKFIKSQAKNVGRISGLVNKVSSTIKTLTDNYMIEHKIKCNQ